MRVFKYQYLPMPRYYAAYTTHAYRTFATR